MSAPRLLDSVLRIPHAHNSPRNWMRRVAWLTILIAIHRRLTHAANASCRLSGEAWRNGLEPFGPTYGAYGFATDRAWRAQRSAARQTLARHSVREGIHQSAAASEANLRAGRFWSRCRTAARTGGMELRRLRRSSHR